MSDDREVRAIGRVIRLDLVIAMCALLISSLATVASFWQTVVVQKQLSAAVLPYLQIEGTFSTDEIKFAIQNVGVGPAIIKDAVLTDRGVPQRTLVSEFRPFLSQLKRGTVLSVATSDIDPGEAIRAGDSIVVADFKAKGVRDVLVPQIARGDLVICYCSILDQCWNVSHGATAPKPTPACKDHDPDELQPVGLSSKFRD